MISILILIICFGASIIGAICGIGGGVIIKPTLDAFGIMSVAAISFLSGCTVLSMTTYSVISSKLSWISMADYADANYETLLRFTKALYEAMDYAADDHYDEIAGYVAGQTKTVYDTVYAQRGDVEAEVLPFFFPLLFLILK